MGYGTDGNNVSPDGSDIESREADGVQTEELDEFLEEINEDADQTVIEETLIEDGEVREDWVEHTLQNHPEWENAELEEFDKQSLREAIDFLRTYDFDSEPDYDDPQKQLIHRLKNFQRSNQTSYSDEELNNIAFKVARITNRGRRFDAQPADDELLSRKQIELVTNLAIAHQPLKDRPQANKDVRQPVINALGYKGEVNQNVLKALPAQRFDLRTGKQSDTYFNNKIKVGYDPTSERHKETRVSLATYAELAEEDEYDSVIMGVRSFRAGDIFDEKSNVKNEYSGNIAANVRNAAIDGESVPELERTNAKEVSDGVVLIEEDVDTLSDKVEFRETVNKGDFRGEPDSVLPSEEIAERLGDVVGKEIEVVPTEVEQGDYTHYYIASALGAIDDNPESVDDIDAEKIQKLDDDMRPPDMLSELIEVKRTTGSGVNFGKHHPTDPEPFEDYDTDLSPADNRYVVAFADQKAIDEPNKAEISGILIVQGRHTDEIATSINKETARQQRVPRDDLIRIEDFEEGELNTKL